MNREQGTGNREQGTGKGTGKGTGNREQGTGNRKITCVINCVPLLSRK